MLTVDLIPNQKIKAVFSDLDDTLTDGHAGISDTTYKALWDLHRADFKLVIVTGRPAGWADALIRLFPIRAAIFENGAGIVVKEPTNNLRVISLAHKKPVEEQKKILQTIFDTLKKEIPEIKVSTDQDYRRSDIAIDYAEEPPFLDKSKLEKVISYLSKQPDITFKVSSIHVNYWYGHHTKVTACRYLMENEVDLFGKLNKENVLYAGDSPNDEPLFEFFKESVGVANIKPYLPQFNHLPRYLTHSARGAGFVEMVQQLLK